MAFQSFGVPTKEIESMLTTTQNIKFFLRTGYGDSEDCTGGISDDLEDTVKTQVMCQGNGAAPTAWTVTSIPMIAAHKKKGNGAHFLAPIFGTLWTTSGRAFCIQHRSDQCQHAGCGDDC
jgi:hypothetical protein